jgi:predicted transglutaminase-like protease
LRGIYGICPKSIKKNQKMSTTYWDLDRLCPITSLGDWTTTVVKKKRKKKITSVSMYRCEYEHVGSVLITISRDVV